MIILSVYTLLKGVGYYDLSILSMSLFLSVMGFQKKVWNGCELYQFFLGIFGIFLTLQSPLDVHLLISHPIV